MVVSPVACSDVSPEEGEHHLSSLALESRAQSYCPQVLCSCIRSIFLWAKAPPRSVAKAVSPVRKDKFGLKTAKELNAAVGHIMSPGFQVPRMMSIVVVHPWGVTGGRTSWASCLWYTRFRATACRFMWSSSIFRQIKSCDVLLI